MEFSGVFCIVFLTVLPWLKATELFRPDHKFIGIPMGSIGVHPVGTEMCITENYGKPRMPVWKMQLSWVFHIVFLTVLPWLKATKLFRPDHGFKGIPMGSIGVHPVGTKKCICSWTICLSLEYF